MKTTFVSTITLWNSPRSSLDKMQTELVKANKELALGRHADVGLKLGYRTGETISLRQEMAELDALIDSNATVKVRLDATTAALASMRETSEKFRASLISGPVADRNMDVLQSEATANLDALLADLNKQVNGQYIFGGINTQEKPMKDFLTNAKMAIEAEFAGQFASVPAADITAAQMDAFLDGAFAAVFDDANWTAEWTNASTKSIQSSVSTSDRIATSVSAQEVAFRNLAKSYTMIMAIGLDALNSETRTHVVSRVVSTISRAAVQVADLEAKIGSAKNTMLASNDRMSLQKYIFEERLAKFEGVDAAEAKVRVDHLATQIQVSFQLTAQLRNLSLVNFI
ncbi:flagellar hook-associated family protein [Microvirga massiliensis]|uniref:flagellar hook-associated family protein n=1 Tax=Microvirga massiliensis TaxID=1033741 RepID=UPI00062B6318|nr:flagellar hook-associated family protein [Microvirga massiliensis]